MAPFQQLCRDVEHACADEERRTKGDGVDKATPHVFWRTASRRMALVARLIARRETAEEQSAGVSLILALIKSSRAVRAHTGRGVGVGGVSR